MRKYSVSDLFPLVVRLSHFDMSHQVSACTVVEYVRHSDHQVINSSSLSLFLWS